MAEPYGLFAPTQEDIEATQYNQAQDVITGAIGSTIGGIIGQLPQMRKSRKVNQYWRDKDMAINSPITVGEDGSLNLDPISKDNMNFGSLSEEWNNYKNYLESNRIRVTDEDYVTFREIYEGKSTEYGNTLANKFSSMKMRGVSDSSIRDLVSTNRGLYDTMSRIGMVSPEADAQFAPYLKAKGGLWGGLKKAVPEAAITAASFAAPVLGYQAGKTGYQKLTGAKKQPGFFKNLKSAFDLGTGRRFKEEAIKSDALRKKVPWTTKDTKLINQKKAALKRAQTKVDKLQTKAGKLRKGKSQKALTKAQTNLKKATTILDTAKGKTKPMSKSRITSTLTNALRKKGVRGVYKELVERVGRRAALGLMARVGLGTAASFTGIGTAFGVGMNVLAAYQIARALAGALKEVEGDSTFSEKMFGKKSGSSTLKGSQF